MGRLEGKSCLISGGSKGLGAAQARLFAREGALVAVGDILDADGGRLVEELRASGADSVFLRLDVTSEADWEGAVGAVMAGFGSLEVLVNNAGIYNRAPVEETTLEEWERVMERQFHRGVPGHEACDSGHAQVGRRLDRQHVVGRRARGQQDADRLQRLQGGSPPSHQVYGGAVRGGRDPGQLRSSRASSRPT